MLSLQEGTNYIGVAVLPSFISFCSTHKIVQCIKGYCCYYLNNEIKWNSEFMNICCQTRYLHYYSGPNQKVCNPSYLLSGIHLLVWQRHPVTIATIRSCIDDVNVRDVSGCFYYKIHAVKCGPDNVVWDWVTIHLDGHFHMYLELQTWVWTTWDVNSLTVAKSSYS